MSTVAGVINTRESFTCVGYIELDHIIKIKVKEQSSKSKKDNKSSKDTSKVKSFVANCNKWHKYDLKRNAYNQEGQSEFTFIVPEDVPDYFNQSKTKDPIEWITGIEYLKAKLTFDSFVDNFGKVNLAVPRFNQS